MKKRRNGQLVAMFVSLMSCIPLVGCGGSEGGVVIDPQEETSHYTATPRSLNMDGVSGFVVLDNSDNPTRSGAEGDLSTDNGNTDYGYIHNPASPSTLYSIDENNNITVTHFFFDITTDAGTNDTETVQRQISGLLQIVPTLMSDLGEYILFSGCALRPINPAPTEEELKIINYILYSDEYAQHMQSKVPYDVLLFRNNMTFLVRKADGALFDITAKHIFSYARSECYSTFEYIYSDCEEIFFTNAKDVTGLWQGSYQNSTQNNLFVYSTFNSLIYKLVDNGDAIDLETMTQGCTTGNFCVDRDENIYVENYNFGPETPDGEQGIHVYKSAGGFDIIDFKKLHLSIFGMATDDEGNAYVFSSSNDYALGPVVGELKNGKYNELYRSETICGSFGKYQSDFHRPSISYEDGIFQLFTGNLDPYSECLWGYNVKTNEVIKYEIHDNFWALLTSENFDTIAYNNKFGGTLCCGVKLGESSLDVVSIDMLSGESTRKTFEVPVLASIVGKYCHISQATGTDLHVYGLSTANGVKASISIDLLTGESNSTFGHDNRTVVSILKIN